MQTNNSNNIAHLCGTVEDLPEFSHEVFGEKFYTFTLRIVRLSGAFDKIRITISDRLFAGFDIISGKSVRISGQFRSYNSIENGKGKLILSVFAKDIADASADDMKNPNYLYLNGFICKPPVYRTTPFGREICDILLAVNRTYNKSDYIPIIAWGRNARYCKGLPVGENLRIWGRIQSRDYQKKISEDEMITKTAFEVSVSKLEIRESGSPEPEDTEK